MSRISLRAYNREIEGLIEQGHRLDEAVAHCRHILSTYPKHLDTYRLLGKAYLEAKRYDQAVDIFQRVLVAAPEDFVSHVGMSIISDDQGKLDDAIWHMERAFEVQPSNAAIQAELQRLFGRRDGVEPPKIRLTRGALAHMYVQGELYTQAISEIRAVLAHDKGRTDMQVLLARAHFRNGQKAEAAEACSGLLAISPYCFEANRLMAEFQPAAEATEATREYRRRVFELDPYAQFAQGSLFETDEVPDSSVTLERLDFAAGAAEIGPALGISIEPAEAIADKEPARPSWLTPEPAAGNPPVPAGDRVEDVPAFIRDAGWREVASDTTAAPTLAEDDGGAEPAATPGDLPEWVRALAPAEEAEQGTGNADSEWTAPEWSRLTESSIPPASAGDDETTEAERAPDWLQELATGADLPSVASGPDATAQQAEEQALLQSSGGPGRGARDGSEDLAWLDGLAEKHGAQAEEFLTPPEARGGTVPQWIQNAQQSSANANEGQESPDYGSRVFQDDARSQAGPTPADQGQEHLDWLNGLSDQDAFSQIEQQSESELPPIPSEDPTPAWSKPAAGDLPQWIGSATTPAEGGAFGARESSGEDGKAIDLPDWLAGLDGEKSGAGSSPVPGVESDSLPDWLKAERPPSPEVAGTAARGYPPTTENTPPMEEVLGSGMNVGTDVGWPAGSREPVEEYPREDLAPLSEPLPTRARPAPGPSTISTPSLDYAQTEMGRGNIAAALDQYGRLIRRGRSLEEIIRDLRDALYRYPVEVPIWQALGDAYMRANRLQEALDAYTKAEELLR